MSFENIGLHILKTNGWFRHHFLNYQDLSPEVPPKANLSKLRKHRIKNMKEELSWKELKKDGKCVKCGTSIEVICQCEVDQFREISDYGQRDYEDNS